MHSYLVWLDSWHSGHRSGNVLDTQNLRPAGIVLGLYCLVGMALSVETLAGYLKPGRNKRKRVERTHSPMRFGRGNAVRIPLLPPNNCTFGRCSQLRSSFPSGKVQRISSVLMPQDFVEECLRSEVVEVAVVMTEVVTARFLILTIFCHDVLF